MTEIRSYKILTHFIFIFLFTTKLINVILDRINLIAFIFWIFPLIIFYFYLNKLIIRSYQWFGFILIIYFLFVSLRVFGTDAYWLDIVEILTIYILFIHILLGPKKIAKHKKL